VPESGDQENNSIRIAIIRAQVGTQNLPNSECYHPTSTVRRQSEGDTAEGENSKRPNSDFGYFKEIFFFHIGPLKLTTVKKEVII
jgi:hypothetical protein